jgi:hypothetical protein
MRRIVTIALLLAVAIMAHGQFRGFDWGTDMQTVLDEEGEPESRDDDELVYTTTVLDAQSLIGYTFADGGLVEGSVYMLNADAQRVIEALEVKYGEIDTGVYIWSRDDTDVMLYTEGDWVKVKYWYKPWMDEQIEKRKHEEAQRRRDDAESF